MKKTLSVTPSKGQLLPGAVYMAFSLLILPGLLSLLLALLPVPVSAGMANFWFFVLNFLVTVGIFHKFLLSSLKELRHNLSSILLFAALGLILYWMFNLAVSFLIVTVQPDFANVNDSSIAELAAQNYPLMAIGTVALVPIAEELLFRGVLFAGLYNRSRVAAFAVSTLIFCAIHVVGYVGLYPPVTLLLCFFQYIPAGLSLGWAYAKTGSIFAPVLMHTAINAIGILAMR